MPEMPLSAWFLALLYGEKSSAGIRQLSTAWLMLLLRHWYHGMVKTPLFQHIWLQLELPSQRNDVRGAFIDRIIDPAATKLQSVNC
jgi:hypothetical protein